MDLLAEMLEVASEVDFLVLSVVLLAETWVVALEAELAA